MAIPKIIHYCWLSGDPYPPEIKKCIDSWHRYMSDYKFRLWDRDTFECGSIPYVRQAIDCRKWAFASDYIRLWALYNEGGIYLDSDIEVVRSFDPLLDEAAFTGFECGGRVAAWIFGSESGNPVIDELLHYYDGRNFVDAAGNLEMIPNTIPVTRALASKGLMARNAIQRLDGITVFSSDYFCPYNPWTGATRNTENTFAKHHFCGAWMDSDEEVQFMQNTNDYIDDFVKRALVQQDTKKMYIYGAGILGHLVFERLRDFYPQVFVEGFIVSENEFGWTEIEGVPLRLISDFQGSVSIPVLIATIPKHHEAICEEISRHGFNAVYRLGFD